MTEPIARDMAMFEPFCEVATEYWRTNVAPPGERVILVEGMSQWLRTTLRNLTMANALRRIEPARLIVYAGADADWNDTVWTQYSLDETRALCKAYGAELVFDIHALIDDRLAGRPNDVVAAGVALGGDLPASPIEQRKLDDFVTATVCRILKVAKVDDSPEHVAKRAELTERSLEFAAIYEALFEQLDVVALVSSHVDYNNFGLAVEAATRHQVPVLFPQSTGTLKSYALFPEAVHHDGPIRAGITEEVGHFFEKHVWANREMLAEARDRTTYRAKAAVGLPSWWRSGGDTSNVALRDANDRAQVRVQAAAQLGLDPDKPTITVFNHAISDALGTNVEAFADLADWFSGTAEYAVEHPEANWLFLDHPTQYQYDATDFVGRLAARLGPSSPHVVFTQSLRLTKNVQVALSDLIITVRGSVSTEFPTLGIPAIQAGWSDWSNCGFTMVATTVDEYFATLESAIAGLLAGERLLTEEQVERARLWTWFYRSASDLPSPLVPPWDMAEQTVMFRQVMRNMQHVEPDGDIAFSAVRRLWRRREVMLTRMDWERSTDVLRDDLGLVDF